MQSGRSGRGYIKAVGGLSKGGRKSGQARPRATVYAVGAAHRKVGDSWVIHVERQEGGRNQACGGGRPERRKVKARDGVG